MAAARGAEAAAETDSALAAATTCWRAIPPSDVAHGFVRGRSVRTFVAPHVGRAGRRAHRSRRTSSRASAARASPRLFRRVGYPRRVAAALAGLCTAPTPDGVLAAHPREDVDLAQRFLTNARLRDAHLPQGAPTSPALSNLAAWRLDRRLAGLAAGFGATHDPLRGRSGVLGRRGVRAQRAVLRRARRRDRDRRRAFASTTARRA